MSPSTDLRENREFASEIKFLVSPALADQIRDWARGRLAPDPNAAGGSGDAYLVTSLYFDTGQFDVFHVKALSAAASIAFGATARVRSHSWNASLRPVGF